MELEEVEGSGGVCRTRDDGATVRLLVTATSTVAVEVVTTSPLISCCSISSRKINSRVLRASDWARARSRGVPGELGGFGEGRKTAICRRILSLKTGRGKTSVIVTITGQAIARNEKYKNKNGEGSTQDLKTKNCPH